MLALFRFFFQLPGVGDDLCSQKCKKKHKKPTGFLILEQHDEENNLPFANPAALIPLKAKAWLDLLERAKKGEKVDDKDIAKHRADVFRIANTLPGEAGPKLPASIEEDLKSFLAAFPVESKEWPAILSSLKTTFGGTQIKPEALIAAIGIYFRLQ